jgi:hypothetical protein
MENKNGIYPKQKKIVALGDLHGDILQLFSVLIDSKLIKKKYDISCINKKDYSINRWDWIGGNTYLVQLGDIFDGKRGNTDKFQDNEVEIYNFLIGLKKKAQIKGGNVILIIGNHELMNFEKDLRYVQNSTMKKCLVYNGGEFDYIKKNKICNDRNKLFSRPNGPLAKSMYTNVKGIVKIGSNIFCHGGLSYKIAEKYSKNIIRNINKVLRLYLINKIDKNDKHYKTIYGSNGITWYREYSQGNQCDNLAKTLHNLDADRMIVGHTVQEDGITSYCQKLKKSLWAIDVGLSRAFSTKLRCEYLVINNDNDVCIKQCKISKEC